MKILVTGGAGFIGTNLCLSLLKKGHEVTVVDNLSEQIHGKNPLNDSTLFLLIRDKVNFIYGSVCDEDVMKVAISDNEIIVHLAAETGTGQSMYLVKKYVEVNVVGTSLILDILANNSNIVKKFIVASSRALYGEGKYFSKKYGIVYPKHRNAVDLENRNFNVTYLDEKNLEINSTDEESKIHPSSVYGITKQNQEQMVMAVCPTIGIQPIAFRYQNVYGPGQSLKNPYTGILSIFSTLIKNNKTINVFEDGEESRDFVYIDDVVNATILGIEMEEANNEIFNVGTGIATKVIDVANELISNYNTDNCIKISGNFRLGDIRHNFADISKIKSKLGFIPETDFNNGIKKFTDWVNSQQVSDDLLYYKSIEEMKLKGLLK